MCNIFISSICSVQFLKQLSKNASFKYLSRLLEKAIRPPPASNTDMWTRMGLLSNSYKVLVRMPEEWKSVGNLGAGGMIQLERIGAAWIEFVWLELGKGGWPLRIR
jgi:hypothetical protein